MYDNAKEMAEDLAIETQRANEWEGKYTELLAKYVQLLGEYGKIVKCKDCKYWQTSKIKGGEGYHTCMCVRFGKEGIIAFADDFCSRGVKR